MARMNRLIKQHDHDPYLDTHKRLHASVCTGCGGVQSKGVFRWVDDIPKDADKFLCPACLKIEQGIAGGRLVLSGGFLAHHLTEVENIITNCALRIWL